MAVVKVDTASLTAVANALRTAANQSDPIAFPAGFVSAIAGLSSGGVQLVAGTENIAQTTTFTVSGLPFTPTNALLMLLRRTTTKGILVSAISDPDYPAATAYGSYANTTSGLVTNINASNFTFGQNSVTYTTPGTYTVYGVYFYMIWRSEEAQP